MINLFEEYNVASNREFFIYIKLKKMEHKGERNRLQIKQLMTFALDK